MTVYNLSDRKLIWNHFKAMSRAELVTAIIQLLDENQLNKLLKHLKEVKLHEQRNKEMGIHDIGIADLNKFAKSESGE